MKKIMFYMTLMLLSATLFTSCTVEEGDNPNRLTARGMTMIEEWYNVEDAILRRYADVMFRLNHYIETGQNNIIGNGMYFQLVDNDTWEVFQYGEGSVAYTIETNGQPLDSVGSVWELTSFVEYYSNHGLLQDDCTVNVTVSCIDTNTWNVYSINNDMPEYFFDVNMSFKNKPSTLYSYPYEFEGKGNLCLNQCFEQEMYSYDYKSLEPDHYYNGMVNLCFETESPLQKTHDYWSKGVVNVTATNIDGETSSTRAEFFRKNTNYMVEITYGGVTEEWYPFYYYYNY